MCTLGPFPLGALVTTQLPFLVLKGSLFTRHAILLVTVVVRPNGTGNCIERKTSKDVALLPLIVIVQQSSSFVFVWLCIVSRCLLLLSVLINRLDFKTRLV